MSAITHEFSTSANLERLFELVATQDGQRAWWCKQADISDEVGGEHHLRFMKGDQPIDMKFELTERSPKRVAWTCTSNDNPDWIGSTLVWDLSADGDGTKVRLVHDNFASTGPGYQGTVDGWPRFVESLEQVALGKSGNPL